MTGFVLSGVYLFTLYPDAALLMLATSVMLKNVRLAHRQFIDLQRAGRCR
jgi:hypothetical protein